MSKILIENAQLMVTVEILLKSEIFQQDGLSPLTDSFYVVLYSWLNVAHDFYTLNDMDKEVQ